MGTDDSTLGKGRDENPPKSPFEKGGLVEVQIETPFEKGGLVEVQTETPFGKGGQGDLVILLDSKRI